MNIITNSTQDRFLKIKRMLNNTEDIGKSTLVELSNQGEQLKNINSKSNNLYDQLKITKSKLHNIISSISILNIPFSNLNIMKLSFNDTNYGNNTNIPNSTVKIIDNNGYNEMDEISNKLKKLKLLALDINGEIIQQNNILDKISINIDKSNDITLENNNNIIKLIHK
jgi:hypothetical protein